LFVIFIVTKWYCPSPWTEKAWKKKN